MRDPRIDRVADAIEKAFPGTTVVIERCPSPDDPDIDWFLHVLNLAPDRQREVTNLSLRLGIDLFGETSIPFLVGGVSPESTALHWDMYLHGEPARP